MPARTFRSGSSPAQEFVPGNEHTTGGRALLGATTPVMMQVVLKLVVEPPRGAARNESTPMSTDERSDSSTNTVLIVVGVVVGVLLLVVLACGALGLFAYRAASVTVGPMVQAAQAPEEMEEGAGA